MSKVAPRVAKVKQYAASKYRFILCLTSILKYSYSIEIWALAQGIEACIQ